MNDWVSADDRARLVAGRLPEAEARRIADHLDGCDRCDFASSSDVPAGERHARWAKVAHRTAESRQKTLALFAERATGGVGDGLQTASEDANLQDALATIPALERQIAQQENQLRSSSASRRRRSRARPISSAARRRRIYP